MRVYSLTPLLLVALLVAPKPRIRSFAVTVERTATTITVKGCWTASGGPDGFVTTATASGQPTQTHTLAVVTCDSYTFNGPAVGATLSGNFQVIALRRGKQSTPTTKPWTYTEDTPPPAPVIDSISLTPKTVSLAPSGTIKFTGLAFGH